MPIGDRDYVRDDYPPNCTCVDYVSDIQTGAIEIIATARTSLASNAVAHIIKTS
jgi:hypothetical protein